MDLDELKYLSDDEKDRYWKLAKLFESPGWEVLQKWAALNSDEARDKAAYAKTWEDNRLAIGMKIAYDIFKKMDEIHEIEFAALAEERRQEQLESEENESE